MQKQEQVPFTFWRMLAIAKVPPHGLVLLLFLTFLIITLETASWLFFISLIKWISSGQSALPGWLYPFSGHVSRLFLFLSPLQQGFLVFSIVIFSAVLFKNILKYALSVVFSTWIEHSRSEFSINTFNYLIGCGKGFFDSAKKGHISALLGISATSASFLELCMDLIETVTLLVSYTLIMLFISWKHTLFIIAFLPLIMCLSVKGVLNRLRVLYTRSLELQKRWNEKMENILSCIPLIKAMDKEEQMRKIYSRTVNDLSKCSLRIELTKKMMSPLNEVIVTLVLVGVIILIPLSNQGINTGSLSAFAIFLYLARKFMPLFGRLTDFSKGYREIKPGLLSVNKMMEKGRAWTVSGGPHVFPGLVREIEFKNLNFSYAAGHNALRDVSLRIPRGSRVGIIGRSASGKSTLVSLLLRFYDCPAGSIYLDGRDIREFTVSSLRARICLVSQDTYIFNDTLLSNLLFGAREDISKAQLDTVIVSMGLEELIRRLPKGLMTNLDYGVRISSGERQRISLARGLLRGGDIFILDEATNSLDSKTEQSLRKTLDSLTSGKTLLIIAHRVSSLGDVDHIAVLDSGMIIEQGTKGRLLASNGLYNEFCTLQGLSRENIDPNEDFSAKSGYGW